MKSNASFEGTSAFIDPKQMQVFLQAIFRPYETRILAYCLANSLHQLKAELEMDKTLDVENVKQTMMTCLAKITLGMDAETQALSKKDISEDLGITFEVGVGDTAKSAQKMANDAIKKAFKEAKSCKK